MTRIKINKKTLIIAVATAVVIAAIAFFAFPSKAFLGGGSLLGPEGGLLAPLSNLNSLTVNNSFTANGSLALSYQIVSTSTTLGVAKTYTAIDTATAATGTTLTLPLLSGVSNGTVLFFKDESGQAATDTVTIVTATSTDKIDGATSTVINSDYGYVKLVKGSSSWEKQ